jgi:membrane protein DedA with SNARE-associated domain
MPLGRFTLYSVLGTIPWCFGLAGAGWALGSSWHRFHDDFRYVEIAVVVAALALLVWYLRRRRVTKMNRRASDPAR